MINQQERNVKKLITWPLLEWSLKSFWNIAGALVKPNTNRVYTPDCNLILKIVLHRLILQILPQYEVTDIGLYVCA